MTAVAEFQPASGISPVLDIGGDIGAVVVYLGAPMGRGELDIEPTGEPDRRFHTGIHRRELPSGVAHVALFPEVVAGTYDLIDDQGQVFASVAVEGGSVSEVDRR